MTYDLWDVASGNIINTYESVDEVLAVVRSLLDANGAGYADALSLGYEAADGTMGVVAEGQSLAERDWAAADPVPLEAGG